MDGRKMDKTTKKLHHRIKRSCGKAIGDFNLIDAGDRIAVAVSGGKDSWTLLHILEDLRQRQRMKRLIRELSSEIPQIRHSLFSAMGNIHHRQLLSGATCPFYQNLKTTPYAERSVHGAG